jgi:predicted SAM-dependent methyltransferase
MPMRFVRRLRRAVRALLGDGPTGGLEALTNAHHHTRTRVDALADAHAATASSLEGLGRAHHVTATTAEQARERGDAVAAQLPTLLAVIASHNSAARELRRALDRDAEHIANLSRWHEELAASVEERFRRLDEQAESTRRELLFEVRYGRGERGGAIAVEPHVVHPERLPEDGPLRLNLGSGHLLLDDHVNVDARELDGVDVVADVRTLPFDPGSVDAVRSAHLLEHFPVEELRRVVLPHWHSLLRPGGELRTIVPDGAAMIREFAAGRMPFQDLRLVTFGEQDYDGDFHFTMFDERTLHELLTDAGFVEVATVETGRRNGVCFEMEVVARKPPSSAPGRG